MHSTDQVQEIPERISDFEYTDMDDIGRGLGVGRAGAGGSFEAAIIATSYVREEKEERGREGDLRHDSRATDST